MPIISVQGKSGNSRLSGDLARCLAGNLDRANEGEQQHFVAVEIAAFAPPHESDCGIERVSEMAEPNSVIPIHTPPLLPGPLHRGNSGSSPQPFAHRYVVRRARRRAPVRCRRGREGSASPPERIRPADPHRCRAWRSLSALIRTGIDGGCDAGGRGPPARPDRTTSAFQEPPSITAARLARIGAADADSGRAPLTKSTDWRGANPRWRHPTMMSSDTASAAAMALSELAEPRFLPASMSAI